MNWDAIRVWAAIVLLLDAAFGLWNHERVQALVPKINVARMALIEAVAALILVLLGLWL
ncbi:MAG TPA: hypothetical protein PLD51_00940 [Pontiellaceae bacterium]|nr:hypothetical protein [Pontiellaceae bacterium]HPR82397.1 hypothetical protein [Pontiellaceae bacterium]